MDGFHSRRAEAEIIAAQRAVSLEAVRAHCMLADLHLDRATELAREALSSQIEQAILYDGRDQLSASKP